MSALLALDTVTAAILWVVVKATVLLVVPAVVLLTYGRRASAATRHLAWTLVLASIALLPPLSVALPAWGVVVRSAPPAAAIDAAAPAAVLESSSSIAEPASWPAASAVATETSQIAPAEAVISWPRVAAGVYATGVIALLIFVMAQRWKLHRLVRRASVVNDAEWAPLLASAARKMGLHRPVRLLRSRELNIPVTFGTRHPAVMIPAIADTWTEDRRRAVILHELAHVARRDCLTQTAAFGACILYWFHPVAWWTARRLRIESELACDDRVIAAGTDGRDYADHLLEIAYSVSGERAPALAIGMARPRQLEGRLLAALDAARNRAVPPWGVRLGVLAGATVLLIVLSGARPVVDAAGPAERDDPRVTASRLFDTDALVRRIVDFVRDTAVALGFQDPLPGTWEVRVTETKGTVHLRLSERNSSTGNNVPLEQLEGLTAAQLGGGGPVQFKIRRDAGTLNFEGVMRNGIGAGTFTFAPDPGFPAALEKRGFARPTATEQYQMARYDIGFAFVDELNTQGYAKPTTADLIRAGQHGVNGTYLREMSSLGFKLGSLNELIELRDHGVTAAYARELGELGYKGLGAQELRQARDHGVTPEYVRGMRDAGHSGLTMAALINARDHGVTPEYTRELGDAGHRNLPLDKLINVRDHGVSAEYARDMRALGYAVPMDDLVRARDHGVSVEYVRDMAALGYAKLPLATLIQARDHGVSAEYAREIKALGYDNVPLDDLVTLRDHGLTAERIRDANKRAGVKLPIEMLRSLVRGGGI